MDQWVDNQLASLAPNWEPRTEHALEELLQRKRSPGGQRWVRFGMTATILATTAVVLVLLPWQKLWTPKTTPPGPKTAVAVVVKPQQQQTEPAKPTEKTPEPPAKQQTPTPAKEAAKEQASTVENLPDNEDDLRQYLQQLAAARQQNTAGDAQFQSLQKFYDVQRTAAQAPTGTTPPQVIKSENPTYTDDARKAKITGTIEIVITINPDGTVHFEKFVNTLGYGLDEKAREAVERWQFRPGTKDGVPVPTTVNVTVNFSLR